MKQTEMHPCLLSVIVPVYNLEAYVGACLRSLSMQGFVESEYEILCVNDGSTDGSSAIIRQMAQTYPYIRLIEQQNQGVSVARNTGLSQARGEYVLFCDGDDFLEPYCLKRAVMLLKERKATSASFGFRVVEETAEVSVETAEDAALTVCTGRAKPFYSGNIWRFILRRDFLNDYQIRFKPGMRYAEDELFLYHVCRHLDFRQHIYISDVFYNYRMRATSAVHTQRAIRLNAHYADMVSMALEYKPYRTDKTLSAPMRRSTRARYQYAVSNALQDALLLGERPPREVLAELREKGLYPYGLMWGLLKPKHPKTMLVNYMKFLYTVPLYYIGIYKLRHLQKK